MAKGFGQRLAAAMARKGVSQTELGEHVGRTQGTVSLWCADKRMPDATLIAQVATFLEVDPGELTYGTARTATATAKRPPAKKARTPRRALPSPLAPTGT